MRKGWLLLAGTVLLLGVAGLTACGTGGVSSKLENIGIYSQQQGIVVNGQGKVSAAPDLATLTLGVQAQEATVAAAQAKASTAMNAVMAALKADGVAEKDIQTQFFNITQVTRFDEKTQQQIVIGYQVNNTVTAKIRDLNEAGGIIDNVATAGGDLTRINGINFTIEDPTNFFTQARILAMDDAKAKAAQLASEAGVGLGEATFISESSFQPPVPSPFGFDLKAVEARSTPISVGESDITASVQITFSIK